MRKNIPVQRTSEKKKELLRKTTVPSTSSGSTVPWLPELIRAGVIQLPLPAAVRFVTDGISDGVTVNCVRSLCKFLTSSIKRVQEPMKGQGGLVSKSALAALVQDSPP